MDLVSILVLLLVVAVIAFVAFWVIGQMGLPDPINLVARVIVGVILLLVLLGMFTGHVPLGSFRLR